MGDRMLNAQKIIREALPTTLNSYAIGWDSEPPCQQLQEKLAEALLLFMPGIQKYIDKEIQLARPQKIGSTLAVHTERLQTCVSVFGHALRNELEIAENLQPGERVPCEKVLTNYDCIGRASSKTVHKLKTAKSGNNKSRRKKYQFGYFLLAS